MKDVTASGANPPDFDVLIAGAGISGIDAAYRLQSERPGTRFALIESQAGIGGTWRTHRFPGIRSDSDLFTFGFDWKPWMGLPIATADAILAYLEEAVDEQDIRQHIQFSTTILSANWSDEDQLWTLHVADEDGSNRTVTCRFFWSCAGYYHHDRGFTPDWPGMADFDGNIVHPQCWPDDLDYSGKSVAVIGSGATAATLIPALAQTAASVTMIQRSPTYYIARPMATEFNDILRSLDLPDDWYHEIMRRKFLADAQTIARRAREEPDALAAELIAGVQGYLGDSVPIDPHFRPSYRPWHQRIALLPDGDMLTALAEGRARVVTDTIETFTPNGLRLSSGEEVVADIIVTATGLQLSVFGDIALSVNGVAVDPANSVTHRGIMFTELPNFATVFGYLRSSWTLRAGLVSRYICRLLDFMDQQNVNVVVPRLREADAGMDLHPWIAPENFNPGYITRALPILPKQGSHQPWVMTQDYYQDRDDLPVADFDDGTLHFISALADQVS